MDAMPLVGLFLTMVLQVIVPPLPAELIVIGAGRSLGAGVTTLVAGAGLFCGSVCVYCIGRYIHQRLAKFFDRERVKRVLERIREMEDVILWVRVLPYNPSDIISYAAGMAAIQPGKYLLITFATSFVRTFTLAWLGTVLADFKSFFQVGSVLLLSAVLAGAVAYGRRQG